MKTEQPVHLLLRFSDSLLKQGDTICEHNQVVSREGAVWFGKMGASVSQIYIDILNGQIQNDTPTYVFLVKGNRRKSTVYCALLVCATKVQPEEQKHMIPSYYYGLDLIKYMKFWVKLTEITPISFSELEKMRVSSSALPIRESLIKSSTGHFFLVENRARF